MNRINRWIAANPLAAAALIAGVAALVTVAVSGLCHPDGVAYGLGKAWLAPLLALIGYFFAFLPISRSRAVDNRGE